MNIHNKVHTVSFSFEGGAEKLQNFAVDSQHDELKHFLMGKFKPSIAIH